MKLCPTCHATYPDDTIFCPRDGGTLISEPTAPVPMQPAASASGSVWPPAAIATVAAAVTAVVFLVVFLVLDRRSPEPPPAAAPATASAPLADAGPDTTPISDPSPQPEPADPYGDRNLVLQEPQTDYPLPADSPGDWLVIFGSFTEYQNADLEARMGTLSAQGIRAVVGRSEDYPNLVHGLRIVFVGPYTQRAAKRVSEDLKPVIPDVYYKSGW